MFGPTAKWPKNRKIGPKMGQKWQFPHFSAISPPISRLHFSAIFFPILGLWPEMGSVPGNQDRNARNRNARNILLWAWGRPDQFEQQYIWQLIRCLQPISRRLQLPSRRLQPVSAACRQESTDSAIKTASSHCHSYGVLYCRTNTSNSWFLKSIIFKATLDLITIFADLVTTFEM